ncbi:MAG: helix-turn-helix transcriptional regulator [Chlorobia bacterium]|nr:helix-turn-helix transcriptional regulator [Fimbriimonadaceae bacterium]
MIEKTLILTPEQVECIASPVRSELMGAAVRLKMFSVNEIAEEIGRSPKAMYPHIQKMLDFGLVRHVANRLAGKRSESVYEPVSLSIIMPRDNFSPEYRNAVKRKLKSLIRQTEREQIRYLDSVVDEDLSTSMRLFFRLRPDRLPELRRRLMDIGKWANENDDPENGIQIASTFLVVPIQRGLK